MNTRTQLTVGALLFVLGIGLQAFRMLVPPSELAKRGSRAVGQVLYKDSRPAPDGGFVYTVTFVYPDVTHRNYQISRVVPDKRTWDRLKAGGEVRVLYMPDQPLKASIEGGEELVRPHDAAYAYLAWSAILAGGVMGWLAFRQTSAASDRAATGGPRREDG